MDVCALYVLAFTFMHVCFLSPAEHEHIAGRWVIRKRNQLLKTQLLTASVEAVRTVSSQRVIIAAWTVLHGPQSFWALWMIWDERDGHRDHHLHAGLDFLLPGNHQNFWDHMYCTVFSVGSYYVMNKAVSQEGKGVNEGCQGSAIEFRKRSTASMRHPLNRHVKLTGPHILKQDKVKLDCYIFLLVQK